MWRDVPYASSSRVKPTSQVSRSSWLSSSTQPATRQWHPFHQKALAANVRCVVEPKDVFGSRLAQYADPDGLVFSVGEDRPPGR
jgi:hypothetical protein